MSIGRVTTPTNTFKLTDNIDNYEKVEITYLQGGVRLVKLYDGNEQPWATVTGDTIAVTLTQEETKKFSKGKVDIQVRVKTLVGKVMQSQHILEDINETNSEAIL